MAVPDQWKVQLWLGDMLIEEHIAPIELAQRYVDVIRLRINGLPARELRCVRLAECEPVHPEPTMPEPSISRG